MIPDSFIPYLLLALLAIVGLIVLVRSFAMPQSFSRNQEKKEELKKILEKNKTMGNS